ncbi:class I SAM-dependent methyltransferase [Devosia marina]|uniref:Methyltransferase type 11 n=1 Tax=Devosia marina TaxID=2683198 RepID=A0A7X3FNL1_9HYPH|nr:class I SAM-dependent methyltransferase [Devosia marina]MVS97914.1 methyltransferase type 11 [Devosia marina]
MHDTALLSGAKFFEAYAKDMQKPGLRILDLGAMDVNGSLRSAAPAGAEYVGIDMAAGPGVDIVYDPAQGFPAEVSGFDVCVSTSTFEHDDFFWQTFLEVCSALNEGGLFYINAPSNGPYHAYPGDSWRFYPDSGLSLAKWARRMGQQVTLLESGVLRRDSDVWNDFVAVFRKGTPLSGASENRLLDLFPDAMNLRHGEVNDMKNVVPDFTA